MRHSDEGSLSPGVRQRHSAFQKEYARVSGGLSGRFRIEIDEGIAAVIKSPGSAGHFVEGRSAVNRNLRRRNLRSFPFFILYGSSEDTLVFGAVIPNRSEQLYYLRDEGVGYASN